MRYNNEELLDYLRDLYVSLGRPPRINDAKIPDGTTILRRFGGWNAALGLAGVPVNKERNIQSKIKELLEIECAYIAGIIDTDGWVFASGFGYLGIANNSKKFLQHIQSICKGGRVYCSEKNHYKLYFRKNEALDVVRQIKNFLFIKKKQAEGFLDAYSKSR